MAISKSRIQLYIGDNVKEYMEEQADIWGMSVSAYVTMCVNTFKQQQEALEFANKIGKSGLDDVFKTLQFMGNKSVEK